VGRVAGCGDHVRQRPVVALADAQAIVEAAVQLNFGNRTDAEADPDQGKAKQLPFEARHGILGLARIVQASLEQHSPGPNRLRILGCQRPLLRGRNAGGKQKENGTEQA